MNTTHFFQQLLQINSPFSVCEVTYRPDEDGIEGVHITITVDENYRPTDATIHDYVERTWRHLDLFQYPCYLHCRVPKFKYSGNKVRTLEVPWAHTGSGFTLLFEGFAVGLVKLHGCVSTVARQLGIYPQRLWNIVWRYAREETSLPKDLSQVKQVGMDETSRKKGHDYVTCFLDMETGELLYVTPGKDAATVGKFVEQMADNGLPAEQIKDVSVDMSPAFGAGIQAHLPNAEVSYDKFHVSQLVQRAFDSVRKATARKAGKRFNKWMFFTPYEKLDTEQRLELDDLLMDYPKLAKAYELKNSFKYLWTLEDKVQAGAFLCFWADQASELKIRAMTTLAKSLKKYYAGIVQYFESRLTNGRLEGFNSKVQTMKRKARGYQNMETLELMIRWHCAKG